LFSFTETEDFFGTRPAEDPQKTRRRPAEEEEEEEPLLRNTPQQTTTLQQPPQLWGVYTFSHSHIHTR
jgi:hypothetical protein